MIRSVVQEYHRVLPPAFLLSVQLQHQLPEEDLHDLCIAVRLQQTEVHLSMVVLAHYHADPWYHLRNAYWIGGVLLSPLHPPEIRHAQPGLINIDDGLALLHQFNKLHGKALP